MLAFDVYIYKYFIWTLNAVWLYAFCTDDGFYLPIVKLKPRQALPDEILSKAAPMLMYSLLGGLQQLWTNTFEYRHELMQKARQRRCAPPDHRNAAMRCGLAERHQTDAW